MGLAMKVTMLKGKSMELENSHGLMEVPITVNLSRTTLMGEESISGQMGVSMRANGKITRWRVVESSHGQTIEGTRENT